jgi:signal transduction histidine kinase
MPVVSVRVRLVVVITLVAALGLAAVAASVFVVERATIMNQVEDRLRANLDSARFIVEGDDADPLGWSSAREALEDIVRRMSPDDNTGVIGVVDDKIAYLPGVPLDVDLRQASGFVPFAVEASAGGEPVLGTYADEGVNWRFLAAPVELPGAPDSSNVLFVMAYDVRAELAELVNPGRIFVLSSVIVIIVIAGAATVVAGRLLRPLRRMRETAERVSAQSLEERLPIEGRDDVSELAATMNAMLDRLDGALDSQRQLLSDVGHELKTPLTIVRGHVELMDPGEPGDVRETQALVVDELDRMSRLLQDLSSTASLHGPTPVQPVPTDAADLVAQVVRKAAGIDGADVAAGPIAEVVAPLDAPRITQALLQLAQNAVTHGGGRFMIGSHVDTGELRLWVRDYGSGVADADKQDVFERFTRASAEAPGSGLGLNIVQVIARAHGGSATVADAAGGSAIFQISIPLTERSISGVDPHRR